jgi:AcrR family transcriptional regulator
MSTSEITHRRRAPRGQGQLLREEIIAAAERLLIERGSQEAVSIRAIADAVGVTPPSIYMHFADKDELFFAVCDARFEQLARQSNEAAADATGPVDELRRRGEAYIRFGLDNPEQYRILFLETSDDTVTMDEIAKWAALADVVDAARRGIDEGSIVAGNPLLIALSLWATVHGLVSLRITKPGIPWPPDDELISYIVDNALLGIAPR